MYLDHLKLCVVCINCLRYGCCGECYVVSNECDEPTTCLVQPIGAHCFDVMYFGCFGNSSSALFNLIHVVIFCPSFISYNVLSNYFIGIAGFSLVHVVCESI